MDIRSLSFRSLGVSFLFTLFSVLPGFSAAPQVSVDYTRESVWGIADPSVSVAVTLSNGSGDLKASASVSSDSGIGEFSVECFDWTPLGCPEIEPGDFVSATVGSLTTTVHVGVVEGELDPENDTVNGLFYAPGVTLPVGVRCTAGGFEMWALSNPDGSFSCDFLDQFGADLQPGDPVTVGYEDDQSNQVWSSQERRLEVNYGWDHLQGFGPPSSPVRVSEVTLTHKDSGDAQKGIAQVVVDSDGHFAVSCDNWACGPCGSCSQCPDIVPGDWIEFKWVKYNGEELSTSLQVGEIQAFVDFDADEASGQVTDSSVTLPIEVTCVVIGESVSPKTVATDPAGNFSCDWGGEWDLQPGQWVEILYSQPEGHAISSVFGGQAPHLVIEDLYAIGEAGEGGYLTVVIRYANVGDADAENTTITSILGNLLYHEDTSMLPVTIGPGQQVQWDVGTLAAGDSASFLTYLKVDAVPPDPVSLDALIATTNPFDLGEPPEKYRDWSGVVVPNDTFLEVSQRAWTPDPAPGEFFVWELEACNRGSTGSTDITLVDLFPDSQLVDFDTWWAADPGWWPMSSSAEEVEFWIASIPGGVCRPIFLQFQVKESVSPGATLTNQAVLSAGNDLSGGAETSEEIFVGEPHANLWVQKSWNSGRLTPCGELRYDIRYRNTGNLPVEGYSDPDGDPVVLAIVDTLPLDTTFVDARWIGGGQSSPLAPFFVGPVQVVFELPDLENGYEAKLEVVLQVAPDAAPESPILNTADICLFNTVDQQCLEPPYEEDFLEDNFSADSQVLRDHGPNLRITKHHEWLSEQLELGYWLDFENIGDDPVVDVEVVDVYPDGTSFSGEYDTNLEPLLTTFNHDAGQHRITWIFESLGPGQTGFLHYVLQLDDPSLVPQAFTNSVEILPLGDMYPPDNSAIDFAVRREVGSVHIKLDEEVVQGTAMPGKTVTVTAPLGTYQDLSLDCPPGQPHPDDIWLGGCWSVDPGAMAPGDVVLVDTALHSVNIEIPNPFDAMASALSNTVWGQIDSLDNETMFVRVGLGPEPVEQTEVQTDGAGNFLASFDEVPESCWAEIRYKTAINYADVTFHRLVTCSLSLGVDIDGEGTPDALTDGLVILRYLFGFLGNSLIDGAVSPSCTRCTAPEIEDQMALIEGSLDVDGNGLVDALSDGLLILRYLFGFRGDALIAGAVAPDCTRCSAVEIEAYLLGLVGI